MLSNSSPVIEASLSRSRVAGLRLQYLSIHVHKHFCFAQSDENLLCKNSLPVTYFHHRFHHQVGQTFLLLIGTWGCHFPSNSVCGKTSSIYCVHSLHRCSGSNGIWDWLSTLLQRWTRQHSIAQICHSMIKHSADVCYIAQAGFVYPWDYINPQENVWSSAIATYQRRQHVT